MMAGAMALPSISASDWVANRTRRVLLAQRLQPFAELAGEAVIVEREPAFVDDDQGGTAVEAILDAVEEIGEDGGRRATADQPFGLEGLHLGVAQVLGLGVEQPAPWTADGIGLQGLLQRAGLQQHREAGERPLRHRRGGERGRGQTRDAPSGPA